MITPKSKLVRFKKKNIPSLLSAEWTLFGATFPPPLCKGMWKIFPAVCYWRIFTLYVFLKIPEKSLIYKFLATTGAHQKHLSEYKTEQKTQTSKSSLYAGSSDNLPSPSGCPEFVALASPLHEKIRTVFISVSMAPSCSGFSHPVALINIKQLKRSAVIEKWLLLKLTFRTYLFVFSRETHDPNTVLKRTPPPLTSHSFSPSYGWTSCSAPTIPTNDFFTSYGCDILVTPRLINASLEACWN